MINRDGQNICGAGHVGELEKGPFPALGFTAVVRPGVRFRLWDAGFFADGVVLERHDGAWP